MVYAISETSAAIPVSVLVSVPKKRFHNAVDRNRMKRQIRESYRRNKSGLWKAVVEKRKSVNIAFICITDRQSSSDQIERSVGKLLNRLSEKI